MKIHEYAEIFPPMNCEDSDALVDSMKKYGFRSEHPIILFEGKILDGRNRELAAKQAKVKALYKNFSKNGIDALDYVVLENIDRRHLTPGQRALIALDLEKEYAKKAAERQRVGALAQQGEKGRAAEHAARKLKVGVRTVYVVKRVAKEAPDLIPEIRSGEITAGFAENILWSRTCKRKREKKEKHTRQENDREVKEHLDAIQVFLKSVQTAVKVAEYGKFSPEAAQFTRRRLSKVITEVNLLQGVLIKVAYPKIAHQLEGKGS